MPAEMIAGKTFNAAYQNHTVAQLGEMVRSIGVLELEEEMAQVREFYRKARVPRY